MANVTLSFEAKNDKGQNPGDFEMFVDLSSPQATTISLIPPEGYKIMGANIYVAVKTQIGKSGKYQITPSANKKKDLTLLKGKPSAGEYTTVFARANEGGFSLDLGNGTTSVTLSNPGHAGYYQYLIWVQVISDSSNDYMDPGIRNRN
jgi:hypothetical protein